MQDAEKTIGAILDKQSTVSIGSVDEDGFPNTKAMLAPRILFSHQHPLHAGEPVSAESKGQPLFLRQEGDIMYYSLGVTDPDYCVLKFTATKGRFYSNFSSESFEIE